MSPLQRKAIEDNVELSTGEGKGGGQMDALISPRKSDGKTVMCTSTLLILIREGRECGRLIKDDDDGE